MIQLKVSMLGRINYFNHYDRFKKAILPYISTLCLGTLAQQVINNHLPPASVFIAHGGGKQTI